MPSEHPNKKKDCFPPWEPTGDAMFFWHAMFKRLQPCWEAYHNETEAGTKGFQIPMKEPGRAEIFAHELGNKEHEKGGQGITFEEVGVLFLEGERDFWRFRY